MPHSLLGWYLLKTSEGSCVCNVVVISLFFLLFLQFETKNTEWGIKWATLFQEKSWLAEANVYLSDIMYEKGGGHPSPTKSSYQENELHYSMESVAWPLANNVYLYNFVYPDRMPQLKTKSLPTLYLVCVFSILPGKKTNEGMITVNTFTFHTSACLAAPPGMKQSLSKINWNKSIRNLPSCGIFFKK